MHKDANRQTRGDISVSPVNILGASMWPGTKQHGYLHLWSFFINIKIVINIRLNSLVNFFVEIAMSTTHIHNESDQTDYKS